MNFTSAISLGVMGIASSIATVHADDTAGEHSKRASFVYTSTNEATGNRVVGYPVTHDGSLGEPVFTETGGLGDDMGLGSQGALVLTEDRRFLITVNAGSNDLTVLAVHDDALTPVAHAASEGLRPVSVTSRAGLVYVVNAGAPNSVQGFSLSADGQLAPLQHGHVALSAEDSGPGQVELSPDARTLVVTEKTSNVISTYRVDAYGGLTGPTVTPSAGTTPFGFAFTQRGVLVVSEGASSSLSSYALEGQALCAISSAVPDTQQAACWVAISPDDRYAFAANAGSASISSYEISSHGELTLKDARAAELGEEGRPLDLALARGGRFLYALDAGNAQLAGFTLGDDGSLQPLSAANCELPPSAAGLAAF